MVLHKKKRLLKALKEAGLPFTAPNFIFKYERKVCHEHNKPFLICKRDENGDRIFTMEQIHDIVKTAKSGWFNKHWHWQP